MLKILTVTAHLIVAVAALGGLGISLYNATQISGVHILINSRMSELLELTKSSSKAEGLKEGRAEQVIKPK